MKILQPVSIVATSGWVNCVQSAEVNIFPPVRPRALGCRTILLQCPNTTLLEDLPPKRLNPTNISLFDLLPRDVLATIKNWIIGLKYHDKYKNFLSRIKGWYYNFLYTLPYYYWSPYHKFTPLKFYRNTRYKWALRLTMKSPCVIGTTCDICRTNKHKFVIQLIPQILWQYHIRVDQQRLV